MADGIDIDLSELNRLTVDLGKAPAKVFTRVGLALRKSAADIEKDAKLFAPVDTGNLRNSISSTITGLSAEIGPTAAYGHYVEFGTSTHAPAAYVGPAFDRNAELFVRAVGIAGEEALF